MKHVVEGYAVAETGVSVARKPTGGSAPLGRIPLFLIVLWVLGCGSGRNDQARDEGSRDTAQGVVGELVHREQLGATPDQPGLRWQSWEAFMRVGLVLLGCVLQENHQGRQCNHGGRRQNHRARR